MKQQVSQAIVLARTNYGEADRIITILTPHGKERLLAKGVRKVRSKLAGGIELLSVSELTYLHGRGELRTLVSSRLVTHYGEIVKDIERTTFAYDMLKMVNKITEDIAEAEYFYLVVSVLEALDNHEVPLDCTRLWFYAQLLKLGGHTPSLKTDSSGVALAEADGYVFDFEDMAFVARPNGPFQTQHIKLLRITFASAAPRVIAKVGDSKGLTQALCQLLRTTLSQWHIA